VKLILILSCVAAVVADMLLVWWAKKETHPVACLVAGVVMLNIAGFIWAYSMRQGIESAVAITFYAIVTVLGCSWLGIAIFKEPLSTTNAVGIGIGLVALVLVGLK
jgi:multidrug transporter EmrE-like cation transporter